jgi:hypothetical protein
MSEIVLRVAAKNATLTWSNILFMFEDEASIVEETCKRNLVSVNSIWWTFFGKHMHT